MHKFLRASGNRKFTRSFLYASAATVALVYAAPSWAQDDQNSVETVTVTAEKRSENLQDVPMAVSSISGEKLEQLGLTSIEDIAPLLPNFQIVTANNPRNAVVDIRNTGSGGSNPGIEGQVGVYVDGLYQPVGGGVALASLVDIQDVEILAGPQGTLYGRNTSTGAMVVTTRAPSQTPEAMVDVQAGTFGYGRLSAYYGGGITDNLAFRLTVFGDEGNDWMHDITTGAYIGGQEEEGARVRFLYTPTSDLTINVIGSYDRIQSSCCDYQLAQVSTQGLTNVQSPTLYTNILTPNFLASQAALGYAWTPLNYNNRDVAALLTPNNTTQIAEGELSVDYVTPWGPTLTSVSGYDIYLGDIAVQPISFFNNDQGSQYQQQHTSSESEELRLTSPTGGLLEYLVGLYGYHQFTNYINEGTFYNGANLQCKAVSANSACTAAAVASGNAPVDPPGFGSAYYNTQSTDSAALFAQVKVSPLPNLHFIGGGRVNYTDKQAVIDLYYVGLGGPTSAGGAYAALLNPLISGTYPTRQFHYSKDVETWLGTVQYDVTDDVMVYATASTGFRDGGFNMAALVQGAEEFLPEYTFNYESGFKSSWFDKKVVLNMDAFYMKIHGVQQNVFDGDIINPTTGAVTTGFIVGNAGNMSDRGFEGTLTAKPIDPLSISGTFGLADEKFHDYTAGTCSTYAGPGGIITPKTTPTATTCNYDGLTPPNAPRDRWSIEAEWEQPLDMWQGWNWFVESDFDWIGKQYLDATLDPPSLQNTVSLVNARLGIETESGNWRIQLWGKNLTDVLYYTFMTSAVDEAVMQGSTTTTTPNGYSSIYAPPRTFGLEGTYRF